MKYKVGKKHKLSGNVFWFDHSTTGEIIEYSYQAAQQARALASQQLRRKSDEWLVIVEPIAITVAEAL